MATSETPKEGHVPGIFGGDIPENERIAYEEAHDADIPSNEGVVESNDKSSLQKEVSVDQDKTETEGRDVSSNSSELGIEKDLEKGIPVTSEEEEKEAEKERDPNVVDWEGPDDPENPQNWYVGIQSLQTLSYLSELQYVKHHVNNRAGQRKRATSASSPSSPYSSHWHPPCSLLAYQT